MYGTVSQTKQYDYYKLMLPIAKNTAIKYITNIPQIYHKNTTKRDIVPQKGVVYYKM